MGRVVDAAVRTERPPAGAPPWRRPCRVCGMVFETRVFLKITCSERCSADNRRANDAARRAAPPGPRSPVRGLREKRCRRCGSDFRPRSGRQLSCDACLGLPART